MRTPHSKENLDDLQPVIQTIRQSRLGNIVKKAQLHLSIEQSIKALLPKALTPHCQVLNIRENVLILSIDNAAIATRVRFMAADILKALKKELNLKGIQSIECRVRP